MSYVVCVLSLFVEKFISVLTCFDVIIAASRRESFFSSSVS